MRYRFSRGFDVGPVEFLILANILMFIVTSIRPELGYSLGLSRMDFLIKPWTLLSSMFVHAGFWHIFTNMLTLYFLGRYVYSLLGETRFLIVYFVGGIAGGIVYLLLSPPSAIAVGASGAIFAVAGTLTVMRPKLSVLVFPIPAPIPLWIAVIGGFILLSFVSSVAWQAHLGGLVFGLVMGYFFRGRQRRLLF